MRLLFSFCACAAATSSAAAMDWATAVSNLTSLTLEISFVVSSQLQLVNPDARFKIAVRQSLD